MSRKLGTYTEAVGNIGEGVVRQICLVFSGNKNQTVLVLGGSLYLWADLLLAGRTVVFVYRELNTLKYVRKQLKRLLSDSKLVERQFRTECRPLESDMSDLVAEVSAIAVVGLLHHLTDPRAALAQLLRTGKPLVALDITTELMHEVIVEEGRMHHRVCDEHFICRDAADKVGFNAKEDITELLYGDDWSRWPQLFEYVLPCCWCEGDELCTHRGKFAWLAGWDGA